MSSPEHFHLFGSVYLTLLHDRDVAGSNTGKKKTLPTDHFCIDSLCEADSFKNYFGPSNLKRAFDFCRILETQILVSKLPIVLTVFADSKLVTRAAFLVGAYMIVVLDMDIWPVMDKINAFDTLMTPFTDVLGGSRPSSFGLHIQDCLKALFRARNLEWVDFGP